LRDGIFTAGRPDSFKRNLQRGFIENLRSLLNDENRPFPGVPAAQLASYGLTPINLTLSDIRPMVRAELKAIDSGLPKGGDAITSAHYADLHFRIKEALNPTRPIINLPAGAGGRGITGEYPVSEPMDKYLDCWPKPGL